MLFTATLLVWLAAAPQHFVGASVVSVSGLPSLVDASANTTHQKSTNLGTIEFGQSLNLLSNPENPFLERKPPNSTDAYSGDHEICVCCNTHKLKKQCDLMNPRRTYHHDCRLQLHHCAVTKYEANGVFPSTCKCIGESDCKRKGMWEDWMGKKFCGWDIGGRKKLPKESWEVIDQGP